MAEPATPTHATHDPLLVAALVDRDLTGTELGRARALVDTCTACAELHDDLVSLAAATRALPTPPRPRAFTLSPADVERLRPNPVRRLLGLIGSSRDAFSRPLAMGLTTLGLAGLLVATVPTVLPTGTPSAERVNQSILEASAGPGQDDGGGEMASPKDVSGEDPEGADYLQAERYEDIRDATAPVRSPAFVAISLILLTSGLVLLGLRIVLGRRRGNHDRPGVV